MKARGRSPWPWIFVMAALGCSPSGTSDSGTPETPASAPSRPNVLLISIDTLRPDHLGCYGYPRGTSPALDALARRSTTFARAFAQAGWTLPSHMSLMTSQLPSAHGVTTHEVALGDSSTTLAEALSAAGYETAAFVSWIYLSEKFGFARGFDEYHYLVDETDPREEAAFSAEAVTDSVVAWLGAPRPAPWFLFVHCFDPHLDYEPPPPFDALFDPGYSGRATGSYEWLQRYIPYRKSSAQRIGRRARRHVAALYDGEIRAVDRQVRRLLTAAQAQGDCLVVLVSDHGEELDDHGSMEGHGWTLYDEVLRVPLLVRESGGAPARGGGIVDRPVGLVDVAPATVSRAGATRPATFGGRALAAGDAADAEPGAARLIFAESSRFDVVKRCVRGGRYKLIHTEDTGESSWGVPVAAGYELFDVQEDPREQKNIYAEEHPAAKALAAALEALRARGAAAGGAPVTLGDEEREILQSLGYVR